MGMTSDGLSYWQAESAGIELLDMTAGDLLDRRAQELPTREAVVYSCYPEFGDALNFRWNYQEYQQRVNAVAKGLMALGLHKGGHIAVWSANVPEWPLLILAAAKAGLAMVTINPVLRAAEVEYILRQGDVRALFFMAKIRDHDCLATMRALTTPTQANGAVTSEQLPLLRYMSLLGAPPAGLLEQESWRPALFREMVAGGAQISDAALAERQATVTPQDPLIIMYTSGTTGLPKGAILTHYGLLNNATLLDLQYSLFERRNIAKHNLRVCVTAPFFHVGGLVTGVFMPLYYGGTTHPLLAFDPLKAMQVISREGCHLMFAVPTMLIAMMQHPDFASYDLSSMVWIVAGGSTVPAFVVEQAQERIGAAIGIVFGQTEGSGGLTVTLPDDTNEIKVTTIGKPIPHVSVRIANPETGEIVPVGERGEIQYRGFLVMKGYYNMPERTAETIDSEGWVHSGDLATMDAQGYISIVGRLKDMVIRGGENIFPREIEEFLMHHPNVADVQVVGVPDTFFGEEMLAVVIPKAGAHLTEQELREYCQGRISHQKVPRYFQFVQAYPMTASGKVQKYLLREQAITTLGLK